jgi:hypothetical protein
MLRRLVTAVLSMLIVVTASARAAEQANTCAAATKPAWSAAESWTWNQICAGKPADLTAGFADSPEARRLSAAFLTAILFDPGLRALVPHGGVHIVGGQVDEPLALGNAAPGFELFLERMSFAADVDLHGLIDAFDVSFAGSHFAGLLTLEGARLGANLRLDQGVEAADLQLSRTTVGGSVMLDGIKVSRGANLERISIAHNLTLRRAKLPGVDLLGASIKGDLSFEDGIVDGWAWLENLQVGSDLFMQRTQLARTDLNGATIGQNLSLTGAKVTATLNLTASKIGGDLLMNNGTFQAIVIPDGVIGDNLRLDGSHVAGPLKMPAAHVGHIVALGPKAVFDEVVDLDYARVDGSVVMSHSHFARDVELDGIQIGEDLTITEDASIVGAMRATFSRIGSNVDLTSGRFNSVDFTGATIGAEIRLASSGYPAITWGPGARLTLRNVNAKALQDLPEAWPATLDLEGFSYQQLGGYNAAGGNGVAARDVGSLIGWLAKQPQYSPPPYRTLAEVLRASGYGEKAKQVLYAGNLREWDASKGLNWVWDGMRWAIIGFGLYPARSAIWILILVPLGAIVFGFDRTARLRAMRPIDRLIYSFDSLLPIVTLRNEHTAFDLQSWPKYYLYFHKIMGYVLIAFLLAAVTGNS